jgi:glutathione peroxidase
MGAGVAAGRVRRNVGELYADAGLQPPEAAVIVSAGAADPQGSSSAEVTNKARNTGMAAIQDIALKTIDGRDARLADYAGKVLLIVNVASKCGLTPQYEGLEKLYERYQGQGLEVLGFPANNFNGQEPGSNEEIQSFCTTNFGVKFPMFEKLSVSGVDQHPLYRELVQAAPKAKGNAEVDMRAQLKGYGIEPNPEPEVLWNFEKFLVNRQGEVVGRFTPDMAPEDPMIVEALETELAKG